jgi:succinate-semialdehyde dehydrogenase/glutarate-semialdehyde dehydrogenase
VCTNRIFVQEKVYDVFVEKFVAAVKLQKMGDGLEEGVTIGPLVEEKAIQFVENVVEDARKKGAEVVLGGTRYQKESLIYEPTILTNVNATMDVYKEEVFGPVAPISKFKTEEEVIDYARIWRVAEALEYGMVGINTGMISTTVAPFGGIKESGFGREGSKYGMDDYLEIKYLCFGGIE